jgi:hypothetical protein
LESRLLLNNPSEGVEDGWLNSLNGSKDRLTVFLAERVSSL